MKFKKGIPRSVRLKIARIRIKRQKKIRQRAEAARLRRKPSDLYEERVVKFLKKAKLDNQVGGVFQQALGMIKEQIQTEVVEEIREKFDLELLKLKESGRLYGAEYMYIKLGEFNMQKLNELGERGWKFAFSTEANVILTRERLLSKKWSRKHHGK